MTRRVPGAELVAAMGGAIRAESPVPRWTADSSAPGTRLVITLRTMAEGQPAPPARRSLRTGSRVTS